ncbi:uncharacterized protein NEMAJ01_1022 [Nematocida major]|uniref:uncharacterized protein n=1 Tax=Nematocida major TaxID=1912982 RepID=UPI002008D861|nr:uncharacterized protein NEMAJ01_1022 [Nematocida major]KAH9386126.1 hypothetical protein NEMAJ01_1022 [Nematocida major]
MENNQHICMDLDSLKFNVLIDARAPEMADSANPIVSALSSRIKNSLRNIPRKRRAEAEALVDSFLQEKLKPIFSRIVSTHCVVSPKAVEILTKEATAELSSELSQELYILAMKIDAFSANQTNTYQKCDRRLLFVKREAFKSALRIYEAMDFHCREVLKKKTMKKFKNYGLERAVYRDTLKIEKMDTVLRQLSDEKKESSLVLKEIAERKEEMRIRENISDLEGAILERVLEKLRAFFSNDKYSPNVYFYLKEITENNGKSIDIEKIDFLRKYTPNNPKRIFSVGEVAERIKTAENECLKEGRRIYDEVKKMQEETRQLIDDMCEIFASRACLNSLLTIVKMFKRAEKEAENLQGPEKVKMEEFRDELAESIAKVDEIRGCSLASMRELSKYLDLVSLLGKLSDKSVCVEFACFNASFKKILSAFPNGEISSGYKKALQDLINHPEDAVKKEQMLHEHAASAENCLERLREAEKGETAEKCKLRVLEYEDFAEKMVLPDFSGPIESIHPVDLKPTVTPREVKALAATLEMYSKKLAKPRKDDFESDSDSSVLDETLPEIEAMLPVLKERAARVAKLSKNKCRGGECLRYAYLKKYKSETLKKADMLREKFEAELVPLAWEVVRKFEETPNNPELNEKVNKMLEETAQKEPHRLLTPRFIVENKHFAEELPRVIVQLDKKIAETLGGSSGERTRRKLHYSLTLQNSIFALFFVFMLLSLGLVCSSEFA